MPTFSLEGKSAVITGGTKGLGKGIAEEFAENGASTVIVSRNQADCDAVSAGIREKFGTESFGIAADLTKSEDISNLVAKSVEALGRIDVLVNNAGSARAKSAEELTEEDWDFVLDLDLKAVFFTSQAFGRLMIEQKSGKIINIASALGLIADKRLVSYSSAKGGVLMMTKALAVEWARYNIQVNAICPGYVITDMNRKSMENEDFRNHLLAKTPMRRFGEAGEIAGAAVFLASDAANYMTGSNIVVDGGWTAE